MNVLINAYAVSPNWGSEPGMGWNWIINIAKYCNVFVITEGEWKAEILEEIQKLPQKENIHFYFNPVSEKIRRICWNQGDWRFYWFYRKWQKKTLRIAKEIISNNKIDIIHQLNMIGFREPGYLWKIKDIPLVWGPIGGMGEIPLAYQDGFGVKEKIKFYLKNKISNLQLIYHPRVRRMVKDAFVIGAVKGVYDKVSRYYGKEVILINETGTYNVNRNSQHQITKFKGDNLDVLWVGRLIPTKRLDIALHTIRLANNKNITLTICGVGSEKENAFYKNMVLELGIERQVKWLGKVDHDEVAALMSKSDVFFMTSVADATSTVVVEAISENLPIISFNACGFGSLVKEFAGFAIELSTPLESAEKFARLLNNLYDNPSQLDDIRKKQQSNVYKLSWEYKGEKIFEIYETLVNEKKEDN